MCGPSIFGEVLMTLRPSEDINYPKISIVIAVQNASSLLTRCLDSISVQNYRNFEVVIKDGLSTDDTVSILKSRNKEIAYWESSHDTGIYDAWNKAITNCSGDWICFLGSDDILHNNNSLSNAIPQLVQAQSLGSSVVYCKVNIFSADGKLIEVRGKPWSQISQQFFQSKMTIPHPGCFHHNTIFKQYGNFDTSFKISGDYELLLRILPITTPLFTENNIVVDMSRGGISTTIEGEIKGFYEDCYARKKNGLNNFHYTVILKRLAFHFLRITTFLFGLKFTHKMLDIYLTIVGKPKRWNI